MLDRPASNLATFANKQLPQCTDFRQHALLVAFSHCLDPFDFFVFATPKQVATGNLEALIVIGSLRDNHQGQELPVFGLGFS